MHDSHGRLLGIRMENGEKDNEENEGGFINMTKHMVVFALFGWKATAGCITRSLVLLLLFLIA